jgi:hypothetical protein
VAAAGKTRIELNAEQRRRLALKGKELTCPGYFPPPPHDRSGFS